MKTIAALSPAPGSDFELTEVELTEPQAAEIVVKIAATGLCHTDLSVRDTLPAEMFPRVFGHEGAGVVEWVGDDVSGVAVGDHVVLSFRACRSCGQCHRQGVGYCESTVLLNYLGTRMDGSTTYLHDGAPLFGSFFGQSSFAQHVIAYADNAVVVDPTYDLSRIGPFGCGFQTGAGTVLNVLAPGADDALVVYGAGAVGLAAIAAARGAGVATVVAVDLMTSRLETAASYGATVLNPAELDAGSIVSQIKELTNGGATHALDTTGVAGVIRDGVAALRPRGELAVLGLGAPEITLDAIDVMMNGKVVRGSVEGDSDPQQMVPRLLELAAAGHFDVDRLISSYRFDQIGAAIADSASGVAVKPVLTW
ncbi:NAD(P)-dependent alcohol dehydrogenase [Nocardioides sp. Bht2]|uniref:NAD(P)-dependent alcohol dehydrogenase n=1 Tax=Nocardioides sp. Bht2 TaxID=3392297 RepID=UPI0039B6A439